MTAGWKKVLFASVPLLGFLMLLEAGLRVVGFKPLSKMVPSRWMEPAWYLVSDPEYGFVSRPRDRYQFLNVVEQPWITTDEFGYRTTLGSSEWPEAPVVIFVGDSTTFCAEVDDAHTMPSEVARLLNRETPARVVNAGIRGYNQLQAKRQLQLALTRFPRARIAIYTFVANDYIENLNPIYHYPLQAPTLWWNQETGKFDEVEVSHPVIPFGQSFASYFGLPPPSRWLWTHTLRHHSALIELVAGRLKRIPIPLLHRFIVPSPPLQRLPRGSLGPVPSDMTLETDQFQWAREHHAEDAIEFLLREMDALCRRRQVHLIVTPFTYAPPPHNVETFLGICRRSGVHCLDLRSHFPGDHSTYATLMLGGSFDPHYGPRGTRTFAEALVPELVKILRESGQSPAQP